MGVIPESAISPPSAARMIPQGRDAAVIPRRKYWLFMSSRQWGIGILVSSGLALLLLRLYIDASIWVGVGIVIATLSVFNIAYANKYMQPFPQLAILISTVQLILAAWGNWYYPKYHPVYDIGNRLADYLAYAGPVCILFALGLLFPLRNTMSYTRQEVMGSLDLPTIRRLRKELHVIFMVGIAATLTESVAPASLKFVAVLASRLSFVGAFGFMMMNFRGWEIRLAIPLGWLFLVTVKSATFHDFVLWGVATIFILAYARKWRPGRIIGIMLAGTLLVITINGIKKEYRDIFWYGRGSGESSRLMVFTSLITETLMEPERLFSSDSMGDLMQRANQGWIVNRAMIWTPRLEPYAKGKALLSGFINSILPRVLVGSKGEGSGRQDYERFTGLKLFGGTSMSLGYAGDMYVNFGPFYGPICVGLYGLLLGSGFLCLYRAALKHPIWWAWAAYFAAIWLKAETSTGYILNWLIKAIFVMFVVLWFSPGLRRLQAPGLRAGRK